MTDRYRLDDYLELIERERESRPSEAMLADEIVRLRAKDRDVTDSAWRRRVRWWLLRQLRALRAEMDQEERRVAGPGHVEDVPVSASEPNPPKAGR